VHIHIHHHHATEPLLLQRLDSILTTLARLEIRLMTTMQNILDEVAKEKDEVASVGTLITQLQEQIAGLLKGNIPPDVQAQIDQAFAELQTNSAALATAIATPAAAPGTVTPTPAPAPTPPPATPTP
jgi:hypothetical protein